MLRGKGAAGLAEAPPATRDAPGAQAPQVSAAGDVLAAIVDAQARFIAGARDHAVFEPLLSHLRALTGSQHALVGAYDDTGELPYLLLAAGDSGADSTRPAAAELVPVFAAALGSAEPLLVNDAAIGGRALSHPPMDHLMALRLTGDARPGMPVGLLVLANRSGGYAGYAGNAGTVPPAAALDAVGRLIAACRSRAAGALTEAETAAALTRAERAERAKTAFLSRISRELHAPLTAVVGFADLIAQEAATASCQDFARDIKEAGALMLRFVSDVGEVARIESGEVRLRPDWHDPMALARDAAAQTAEAAAAAGVDLNLLACEQGPLPRLWADGRLLRQALLNLLSNAVRFTPTGGRVDIVLRQIAGMDPDDPQLEIEVTDTGVGIARDRIDHLFEPFLHLGTRGGSEGTGLGLALARSFVTLNGGTLTLDSDPGAGTTARILLPFGSTVAVEA
ncbi:HAMP domain-containing sensor histidine kinase [Arenibaculum sp.]|uniref:sensor histidine kinase n=1 Tax=Arenibaculum sp. TaxID=2865862 RepID=UPI002E10D8A0|nr:HAMP domain-containing sensor histidine kinase [Arenibaculum sp.]